MTSILNLLSVALLLQTNSIPCEPTAWGEAVDGLQLAVQLIPSQDDYASVRVTVRAVGNRQLLLPVAVAYAGRFLDWPVTLVVSTPQGRKQFARWPYRGSIEGRLDPVSVPMLPGGSYVFEIPVVSWYRPPMQKEELRDLVRQPGRLWIEREVKPAQGPARNCPIYGPPGKAEIFCWENKMVSNTLILP